MPRPELQRPRIVAPALLAVALGLAGCRSIDSASTARPKPPASPEARLADLRLLLPPPTRATATIKPLVVAGNLVFVSGHVARRPDGSMIAGRVGEDLDVAAAKAAARQVGLAILSSLRAELGSLDRVKRVVKVLGMVNCPAGFRESPAVINGCSELFIDLFGPDNGKGARSAVGMNALPGNAAVEIEAIFELAP